MGSIYAPYTESKTRTTDLRRSFLASAVTEKPTRGERIKAAKLKINTYGMTGGLGETATKGLYDAVRKKLNKTSSLRGNYFCFATLLKLFKHGRMRLSIADNEVAALANQNSQEPITKEEA